ncbi:hypothetical protein [Streptomyces sp. KS_5]|uniref:hypothetical protein n=1 Tax=Streptomyces sp. KS_5 TaxID=1881018 RepID=UPI00115F806F|nr:hypothetical protein [Streptomyces sp. KS_5]
MATNQVLSEGALSWTWLYASLGISVLLMVYAESATANQEADRLAASRQRVRAAESDLESALRIPDQGVSTTEDETDTAVGEQPQTQTPTMPDVALGAVLQTRLALPELWAVTHSRLDLYHDIATGQAKRSFRNAQYAMAVGFALLVIFAGIALSASTTAGSVVAGGLGAVSAALAGYVSRTFVKSQEAAAAHLRAYFDQPLEFSRYLAAERIIRDSNLSQEQEAEVLAALVQAMASGPPTPLMPGVPGQQPGNSV